MGVLRLRLQLRDAIQQRPPVSLNAIRRLTQSLRLAPREETELLTPGGGASLSAALSPLSSGSGLGRGCQTGADSSTAQRATYHQGGWRVLDGASQTLVQAVPRQGLRPRALHHLLPAHE